MKEQNKSIRLLVFNIKLFSNKRKGEGAYRELFNKFYELDPSINTYGEKCTEFRTMFGISDADIVHGTLLNFSVLDPDNWFDKTEDRPTRVEIPEDKLPNCKIWEYFFIPSMHRLCFFDRQGVSSLQIGVFLEKGLSMVIDEDEEIKVSLEVSTDAIERILNADEITYLKVNLSYSNNDLTSHYQELIDNEMRESNVSELEVEAKGTLKVPIELDKSKLLRAYITLSQSNGTAEATVIENKQKVKIITKNYPRRVYVPINAEGDILKDIFKKMQSIFRPNVNG